MSAHQLGLDSEHVVEAPALQQRFGRLARAMHHLLGIVDPGLRDVLQSRSDRRTRIHCFLTNRRCRFPIPGLARALSRRLRHVILPSSNFLLKRWVFVAMVSRLPPLPGPRYSFNERIEAEE